MSVLSRTFRPRGLVALLVAMALFTAACGGDDDDAATDDDSTDGAESDEEFEEVTLLIVSNNVHIPAMVALEQGYWLELGLDVKLEVLDSGREIMTAIGAGEAEFGGANAASTIPPARAGGLEAAVVVPYMNDPLYVNHVGRVSIIARTDSGIDPDDPSTLVGKRIGNLEASTTDSYIRAYLDRNGIPQSGPEFVNTPAPDMPIAIQQGDVDAVVAWEPYASQILREMGDDVVAVTRGGDYVSDVIGIAARDDLVAEQPELVEKFVLGAVRGAQYVRQNPEESAEILLNYLSGVELDDAVEGNELTHYDPRVSVCTETGVMAVAQGLIDDGTIESEPFENQDLLNVDILDQVVEENPEYFDDVDPLPETVDDCL